LRRSACIAVAFTLKTARAAQNFGAVAPASKPENGGQVCLSAIFQVPRYCAPDGAFAVSLIL